MHNFCTILVQKLCIWLVLIYEIDFNVRRWAIQSFGRRGWLVMHFSIDELPKIRRLEGRTFYGLKSQIQIEYPLSDILKSENFQKPKMFACRHEHNAVQM
jgi:hypothetical protein